jgi:hypothetical protein
MAASGDLSRRFRCGLGKSLLITGVGAVPTAATAGATAVFTFAAVAAGVAVGSSGGIAGIAIIVAGLLVIRNARC